jgi:hypothetical protein
MQIEFAGQSVQDADNVAADPGRLFNCYRQPVSDVRKAVKSVLGMDKLSDIAGGMCRAMGVVQGVLYVAHGGVLWTVDATGATTYCGDIPDSPETTIAGNNQYVTVVANGRYFVWDGSTLAEPTAGAFSDFASVDFLNQATMLVERNGRRFQWSELVDPYTLDGLDFATTESRDDNNIRGMSFGPEFWIFKETSIERIAPNPAAVTSSQRFSYIPGSTIDKGLLAFGLLCKMDTGGFFVGSDGKAYILAAGGMLQRVSIPPVETAIAQGQPATAFYYRDEGHEFVCVTFADRPAWCLDITTNEWHERGEGVFEPWSMRHASMAYDGAFACNDSGNFVKLVRNNEDFSGPLRRIAVSRLIGGENRRFRVSRMQVNFRTGFTGTAMLRTSPDRGMTWSDPKERSVGDVGEYRTQVAWRALGMFRNFVCELSISDPVECPFESFAVLDVA